MAHYFSSVLPLYTERLLSHILNLNPHSYLNWHIVYLMLKQNDKRQENTKDNNFTNTKENFFFFLKLLINKKRMLNLIVTICRDKSKSFTSLLKLIFIRFKRHETPLFYNSIPTNLQHHKRHKKDMVTKNQWCQTQTGLSDWVRPEPEALVIQLIKELKMSKNRMNPLVTCELSKPY